MSKKIENVKALYLEGIRDGRVRETVTKCTGDRYTQHSTGVADGVEGFVAFFEPFIAKNPVRDIQIVRAFEDGNYVFVHAYQDINNGGAKWVTADIFETDKDDKIIEHWDTIQAYEEKIVSGRTMVDGPTDVEDLDKTEENKALVQEFYDEILIRGNFKKVTSYISTEQYDQHNPWVGDGLKAFGEHVKDFRSKGRIVGYEKMHLLVGQGNFVAALSHTTDSGEDYAFIDLFRIKAGKIVEHWDIQEKILAKDKWLNSGKF